MFSRSSYAHGIPPKIARNYFDVPPPTIQNLLTEGKSSVGRIEAAESFVSLCKLSIVLGDILPVAYDLHSGQKDLQKELRRLECDLDAWEASLPELFQSDLSGAFMRAPGSCNLRFCHLSIKVLLCRIALRVGFAPSFRRNKFRLTMSRLNQVLSKPATKKCERTAWLCLGRLHRR